MTEASEELILDERQAYCRGKLGGTNPYKVGTKLHTLWIWGDQYREYCKKDKPTTDGCYILGKDYDIFCEGLVHDVNEDTYGINI